MGTLRKHFLLVTILLLTACGGGGGETKPDTPPTPPPVSTPDPTITLTKLSDADTNLETSVFKIEGSDNISAFTFDLSNVASAYIVGNGQKTQITNSSVDVSGMNLKDYEVSVMHDTAGTMNLTVSNFTVNGKSYNYDGASISVTFTEKVVEATAKFVGSLNLMNKSTIISTDTDTQQVKKGETVPVLNVNNLTQHLYKQDEVTKIYEFHSETSIVLVDGKQEEVDLPIGLYLRKVTGDIDTAGLNLTLQTSNYLDLSIEGSGLSLNTHLYWSNLTKEYTDFLDTYDNSFNNGDDKDITPYDINEKGVGYIVGIETGERVSLTESAIMQYDIITLQDQMYYDSIVITSDHNARVSLQLGDGNVIIQDIVAGVKSIFSPQQYLDPGITKLNITFNNVAYDNGNNLIYTLESLLGPEPGTWNSFSTMPERSIIINSL